MMAGVNTTMPGENLVEARVTLAMLKAQICDHVTRICAEHYGKRLRAIVLTGSLARDEATLVRGGEVSGLLGDAEFLLIFRAQAALPSSSDLLLLRRRMESSLLRRGIGCAVMLGACHPTYLQGLPPHIFSYELRACGQVVWGEPLVLELAPAYRPSEISQEDAWRLLANRMVEQLELATEPLSASHPFPLVARYRTIKLYLDLATSFLVFSGSYAPTYRGRLERLRQLAAGPSAELPWGDSFSSFIRQVELCTEWKLSVHDASGGDEAGWDLWERAVADARRLWRWELASLTGSDPHDPENSLFERWVRLQPLHRHLRGWLVVLRKRGWHRSWREWPRWARAAWHASPRYWVYGGASRLLFRLPWLMRADSCKLERDFELERIQACLPEQKKPGNGHRAVGLPLAANILWNYKEFVKETRA